MAGAFVRSRLVWGRDRLDGQVGLCRDGATDFPCWSGWVKSSAGWIEDLADVDALRGFGGKPEGVDGWVFPVGFDEFGEVFLPDELVLLSGVAWRDGGMDEVFAASFVGGGVFLFV